MTVVMSYVFSVISCLSVISKGQKENYEMKSCPNAIFLVKINPKLFIELFLEYSLRQKLRYIKIHFTSNIFDIVTKERAATFVDMISEIGGTMGLLTGFSIITAVEIVYFATKIMLEIFSVSLTKKTKVTNDSKLFEKK